MAQIKKEYLAHTRVGLGGSWARDKTIEDTIKRCAKIAHSDWKHLYKMDGEFITIGLYDVTGMNEVFVQDDGVWHRPVEGDSESDVRVPMMRKVEVLLPGKKKK